MSTPSLSFLMRARKAGINPSDMTPEELAQQEAQMVARQQPAYGPRGQSPAGQTVSPQVFAAPAPDTAGMVEQSGAYTNDPRANVRASSTIGPATYAESGRQLMALASRVPGWRAMGVAPKIENDIFMDPNGTSVDLRDERAVGQYFSAMSDMMGQPATPARAQTPQPPDVLQGLILKATESDPASSTFLQFPKPLAEKFGILGVDAADLSIGEKILLRRMGVSLPAPKRRRR